MIDYRKHIEDNKELLIKRLQDLVAIPSVLSTFDPNSKYPFGKDIDDALRYFLNMAEEDGFDTLYDDGFCGEISYGNKDGKLIGILGHLDVVPIGSGWTYPPLGGVIDNGYMYGRGTIDDKGPILASYFALKIIKDLNIRLKNNVKIILGTDEETGWRGVEHYFANHEMPVMGFSPDSSFPLIYAEKGRMEMDLSLNDFDSLSDPLISIIGGDAYNVVIPKAESILSIDIRKEFELFSKKYNMKSESYELDGLFHYVLEGKQAHAMEPEKGINAGIFMCYFLKDYTNNPLVQYVAKYHFNKNFFEEHQLDYDDFEMGKITVNIGIMNITKNFTRVTLDSRFPVRYDIDHFKKVFNEIINEYNIKITHFDMHEPHYVDPNSDFVKKLYNAYTTVTSDFDTKPLTCGGGTYARMINGAVAFGPTMPNEEELCHQPDERISINMLLDSVLIYILAILAIGEIDA